MASSRPKLQLHLGLDFGATYSAVRWWVTNDKGKILSRSPENAPKFPTRLAYNPTSAAGPVRFVRPEPTVEDPERTLTFFKCMLLEDSLAGEPNKRDEAAADCALTNVRQSGCTKSAEDLISAYMEGLWSYAFSTALGEYHDSAGFHPTNTRTIVSMPECFDGKPADIFRSAVDKARQAKQFMKPRFTTEHASVQYLRCVLIDCGGLTLDAVCCRLQKPEQGELHSSVSRCGGGIFIDVAFAGIVDEKIEKATTRSKATWTEQDQKAKDFFMNEWKADAKNSVGKKTVTGQANLTYVGEPGYPAIILNDADLKKAFEPTIKQIVGVIKDTCRNATDGTRKPNVKAAFLSGGLSENAYIVREVGTSMGDDFTVGTISHRQTSVAEGLRFVPQLEPGRPA